MTEVYKIFKGKEPHLSLKPYFLFEKTFRISHTRLFSLKNIRLKIIYQNLKKKITENTRRVWRLCRTYEQYLGFI